jgi:hypothetical protein
VLVPAGLAIRRLRPITAAFATLARYHQALDRVRKRYPVPPPLPLEDLDAFLDRQVERYAVDWK